MIRLPADIQNLQVKLVSNPKGFNQIDKRWLKSYNELWNISENIYELLQHFTGEKPPKISNPRGERGKYLLMSFQKMNNNYY